MEGKKREVRILIRCFLRTYLIGAAYNTKGLQNLGLLYIMDPGLRFFYRDNTEGYLKARERYLDLYNSHPYFLPFLVGYFLFLEARVAKGLVGSDALAAVKQTSAYTLSAIGDSFFGGSLLVLWALLEALLLLYGMRFYALLLLVFFFLLLQSFRFFIFWKGWKRGLSFFQRLKEINLISWSHRIKILNSILVIFIWRRICMMSPYPHEAMFLIGGAGIGLIAFGVARYGISKELVVILGILFLLFL